jgi:hypothetical protein
MTRRTGRSSQSISRQPSAWKVQDWSSMTACNWQPPLPQKSDRALEQRNLLSSTMASSGEPLPVGRCAGCCRLHQTGRSRMPRTRTLPRMVSMEPAACASTANREANRTLASQYLNTFGLLWAGIQNLNIDGGQRAGDAPCPGSVRLGSCDLFHFFEPKLCCGQACAVPIIPRKRFLRNAVKCFYHPIGVVCTVPARTQFSPDVRGVNATH